MDRNQIYDHNPNDIMGDYIMNIKVHKNKWDSSFFVEFNNDSELSFSGTDTEREIAERIGWEMLSYIREM